jgi:hypothetical protein
MTRIRQGSIILLNYGGPDNALAPARALQPNPLEYYLRRLRDIATDAEFEPAFQITRQNAPLWDPLFRPGKQFYLGWQALRVLRPPTVLVFGQGDRWIGQDTTICLDRTAGGPTALLTFNALPLRTASFPIRLEMWQDQCLLGIFYAEEPGTWQWAVNLNEQYPIPPLFVQRIRQSLLSSQCLLDPRWWNDLNFTPWTCLNIKASPTFLAGEEFATADDRRLSLVLQQAQWARQPVELDHWMRKTGHFYVPRTRPASQLLINGRALNIKTMPFPIHLQLWVAGNLVSQYSVHHDGTFQWLADLHSQLVGKNADGLELKIVSDKTFVPRDELGNDDTRNLSVIIYSLQFVEKPIYYPDHWMGRQAEFTLDPTDATNTVLVSGRALAIPGLTFPIQLSMWENQNLIGQYTIIRQGDFSWLQDLPPAEHPRKLKIVADKTFIPANALGNNDYRQLSVMIDQVKFSPP